MIYDNLRVTALTPDWAARTCGPYRYTVTSHCTAHTAFRSRAGLFRWLNILGLSFQDPEPAIHSGDTARLEGSYRKIFCGDPVRIAEAAARCGGGWAWLHNGRYVQAAVELGKPPTLLVAHYPGAPEFPYHHTENAIDPATPLPVS